MASAPLLYVLLLNPDQCFPAILTNRIHRLSTLFAKGTVVRTVVRFLTVFKCLRTAGAICCLHVFHLTYF